MFDLWVLGTSSALPAFGRNLSAQIVECNHRMILIDCGEATQHQINRYKLRIRRLDAILISHLHGDHVFGLMGLLTSLSLTGRTDKLQIVGPPGLREFIEIQMKCTHSHLVYELEIREVAPEDAPVLVFQNDHVTVTNFPLFHRIPCMGYLIREKPKRRKFLFDKAQADEIPRNTYHLLKQGNIITLEDGRVIDPEPYLDAPDPPFSYAYCSDTRFAPEELVPYIKDVTVLYHEATFLNDLIPQAEATFHSTALQAGMIAKLANASRLVIGHYSARYSDLEQHWNEAKSVFPTVHLAVEGVRYPICPADNPPPVELAENDEEESER